MQWQDPIAEDNIDFKQRIWSDQSGTVLQTSFARTSSHNERVLCKLQGKKQIIVLASEKAYEHQ